VAAWELEVEVDGVSTDAQARLDPLACPPVRGGGGLAEPLVGGLQVGVAVADRDQVGDGAELAPSDQSTGIGGGAASDADLDPAAVCRVDPQTSEPVAECSPQFLAEFKGRLLPADSALRLLDGDVPVLGERGHCRIGRVGQVWGGRHRRGRTGRLWLAAEDCEGQERHQGGDPQRALHVPLLSGSSSNP
jgi:hypothetical protein